MNPLLRAIVLQSSRGGLHGRQSGSPPEARGARMAPPSVAQGDDARRLVARGGARSLLLARKPPAWREVYTRILDELLRRHTTWWAAVDWLTQIGPDPDRARYP